MPKRIITDATWMSKKIRSVQPPDFRSEYAWIMPIFEDNGVAEYDPERTHAEAYVLSRPDIGQDKVKAILDEFVRVGLYKKYEGDGKTYLYLVGSEVPGNLPPKSQRFSKLPLPPAYGDPTGEQGLPLPGIGFGIGLGSGLGLGSGSGNSNSEQTSTSVQTSVHLTSPEKTETQIKCPSCGATIVKGYKKSTCSRCQQPLGQSGDEDEMPKSRAFQLED
jgi:hypothetical protein